MFSNPLYQQLHTKIARYIAPYDAAVRGDALAKAREWISDAEAQHEQVLIAFYHSEHTPTKMPSVATYKKDVAAFVKEFPHVRQYQSWDESNRGNIRHVLASPSASSAAKYYQALVRVCKGCTAIGLDVLDAANITPTLRYISAIQAGGAAPAHGHAEDLGAAQLLRREPPRKLADPRADQGLRRPGLADRDGRDRPVRPELQEQARLRSDACGQGAQVHVLPCRRALADQAALHLRLEWRRRLDPLRCGADELQGPASGGLRRGLPPAARRGLLGQDGQN